MAKPMRALVTAFWPCWAFLGSPLPAPIIKLRPPKIKRKRRIIPAIVRELLMMTEIREEAVGKVWRRLRGPQGRSPILKA